MTIATVSETTRARSLTRTAGLRPLGRVNAAFVLALIPGVLGQAPADRGERDDRASRAKHDRLVAIYTRDIEGYTIFRDPSRKDRLELRPKPVYVWTNPTRAGGQDGAVFLWTCKGRAEAIGTVFSFPANGPRTVVHELHSLAPTILDVTRQGAVESGGPSWKPGKAGVALAPIPGSPTPERTPAQRMSQMRALARDFTGTTEDRDNRTYELRLLPKPLYRYQSTDPDVLDGALFAFVSPAGTDPEVILLIEARHAPDAKAPSWHYALARYTDLNLRMRYRKQDVFSAPFLNGSPDVSSSYRIFEDRRIPAVEESSDQPQR
jgi:hypothetical protein